MIEQIATAEQATAEKGYAHPGSAIELPNEGGAIHLQYGHPDEVGRNGCFTSDVISGLMEHLSVYQVDDHPMRCHETTMAIRKLEEARRWIERRKHNRQARGVLQTDKA